ncbi:hypothetical protein [Psychrobacter sp. T6-4]|uniref:hypothetical protein n=2 Tax=Psychrobacter TaxID=497 RepID=UPI003FCF9B65
MSTLAKWQRKFILVFKSEKRLNAGRVVKTFNHKSYEEMKATTITESMCNLDILSDRPKIKDLEGHLNNVKYKMIGQSELCFYQVTLIILLRRRYKIKETFAEFERLWNTESEYLLEHLSIRWIVSACDTFIDHSEDINRATILMNVITLINTLRAYETKAFLQTPLNAAPTPLLDDKINMLYAGDLPLYAGLTYFRVGTDDSLRNMRKRYKTFYKTDELATTILLSIFNKLQFNESAFSILRTLHKTDWSEWWVEE